jgi:putative iron-regulated protein
VEDAYLGRYGNMRGPSLSDLVRAHSPSLDAQITAQFSQIRAAVAAIVQPFDHSVLAPAGSPENQSVAAAVQALQPLQALLDQAATALGIANNL